MKHLLLQLLSIFTNRNDIYPAKKQQNEKISKKTKGQGKVVTLVERDDKYAEIIDDHPVCSGDK